METVEHVDNWHLAASNVCHRHLPALCGFPSAIRWPKAPIARVEYEGVRAVVFLE